MKKTIVKKYDPDLVKRTVDNHWRVRRFNYGMTGTEIKQMIQDLGIKSRNFWKQFGVNTVVLDKGSKEVLYYFSDIERTIAELTRYRDVTWGEWD